MPRTFITLQGCPRCRGAVQRRDKDETCIACGWAGETQGAVDLFPTPQITTKRCRGQNEAPVGPICHK